jgi:hypothetical protein
MSAALTPRVRTLVICDDIQPSEIEENVFHLWGARYQVFADSFPLWCELRVFLVLSHVHPGRFPAFVSVIDEEIDAILFTGEIQPEFTAENTFYPCVVPIRVEFPNEGRYWVQVAFGSDFSSATLKKEEPIHVRTITGVSDE